MSCAPVLGFSCAWTIDIDSDSETIASIEWIPVFISSPSYLLLKADLYAVKVAISMAVCWANVRADERVHLHCGPPVAYPNPARWREVRLELAVALAIAFLPRPVSTRRAHELQRMGYRRDL
jgi:hypothetical protein